jgi:acetyltransferase
MTEGEAVAAADSLGYPVAVKLNSFTITHKTEVGGVKLALRDASAVVAAYREIQEAVAAKLGAEHFNGVTVQSMFSAEGYELIVGSAIDAQFGPVLLFGTGGQLVEVFQDRALSLPPLNTTLARRFIEQTRIFTALKGVRGRKPVDIAALEHLLVRFSQLVLEQKWIREIDINPLLASSETLLALDARVVVYEQTVSPSEIPKPAIRPYPSKYVGQLALRGGELLQIRPIRPDDEPEFVRFHTTLSDESVYRRYFFLMNLESRIRHERLTQMCFIDYDRQMALIAERTMEAGRPGEIVGVGRLIKQSGSKQAEVAVLVSDAFQNRGIGSALVQRLIEFARDEKLELLAASFLADNEPIAKLFKSRGFTINDGLDPEVRQAELRLS